MNIPALIREACDPNFVRQLVCQEMCKVAHSTNPECPHSCVEAAKVASLFRTRFCKLATGIQAAEGDCSEAGPLARSFIHFQSTVILGFSCRSAYSAWKATNTWGEFLKRAAVPVIGITLGLSGLAVAIIV